MLPFIQRTFDRFEFTSVLGVSRYPELRRRTLQHHRENVVLHSSDVSLRHSVRSPETSWLFERVEKLDFLMYSVSEGGSCLAPVQLLKAKKNKKRNKQIKNSERCCCTAPTPNLFCFCQVALRQYQKRLWMILLEELRPAGSDSSFKSFLTDRPLCNLFLCSPG